MSTTTILNDVNIQAVGQLVDTIKSQPEKAHTKWNAEVVWKGGFRSEATIGEHTLQSDEPHGLGGAGTAPNPVEQLLAALGNCLAVGYAATATVKHIALDEVSISLEGNLDLRTFLGLAQGNAGYESIGAVVKIKSNASLEQLKALHEQVVASSPVGHTLSRAVPVSVKLAEYEAAV